MLKTRPYRLLIVAVCLCMAGASDAEWHVIYIDPSATGANDGSSWVNAYVRLQEALAEPAPAAKPVEIRVAQGVCDVRFPAVFSPLAEVVFKGGYAGLAGAEPNDRDPVGRATIISDDLSIVNAASLLTFDGFTFMCAGPFGGINMRTVNSAFVDCRFVSTNSCHDGAIEASDCSSVLMGCRFEGSAWQAIYWQDGDLTLRDCTFAQKEHSAVSFAGPLRRLEVSQCSFADNGQAIRCHGTLAAHACTFAGNGRFAAPVECRGDSTFTDCRFTNNAVAAFHPGAVRVYDGNVTMNRCLFAGNATEGWSAGAISSSEVVLNLSNCLFAGNVSKGNGAAVIGHYGPILRISNGTFVDSRGQRDTISHGPAEALAEMTQSIVRDGPNPFRLPLTVRYSNVEGGYAGEGNIDVDPHFVAPGYWDPNGTPDDPNDDVYVLGDYHLKSQAGHWNEETESWVLDDVTSPCIDAGDPNAPLGDEPFPNGGYINLGAYGGTAEASRSYFGGPVCETRIAGDINGDCQVDDLDLDILMSHWLMDGTTTPNIPPTIAIASPENGAELTEPTPIVFRVEASDSDGTIVQVTYKLTWDEVDAHSETSISVWDSTDAWAVEYGWTWMPHYGVWEVRAEAIDDDGARAVSAPITFTLHPPE